ncbi:hypothetical protein JCM19294_63 [Nonlabens tegetincola]|uniref:Uncharacterized protein n=1 Tax=Nonlabens tegetincola TaxID=323273 RepID=A0A090Q5S6_9FLAO|nr:hypothetical protein JCM19294_63 [Nonlabens tegetincola]
MEHFGLRKNTWLKQNFNIDNFIKIEIIDNVVELVTKKQQQ